MSFDSDPYKIDTQKGILFVATHLLVLMEKTDLSLGKLDLRGNRQAKEAIVLLEEKKLITSETKQYQLTELGREKVVEFQNRYSNILTYIDIFGFIDLEKGEFAFQKFGTFDSETQWNDYLADNRWTDLRIAMIDYLDGDATELVFAQLILENQTSLTEISWADIESICNEAKQEEDLSYKNGSLLVSGSEVLDDIYDKAVELLKGFHPDDVEIQHNLNTWYSEPEKATGYGSSIKIKSSKPNSTPLWETPWTI